MQTILGSGGAIGVELAKALKKYTDDIRLVSRNPQRVNATDQLLAADLLDPAAVKQAVAGSQVVYLTVGFPYNLKTWRECWPKTMANVIAACADHRAKLVFFDNIYMYDKAHLSTMTEDTPMRPPSKKGLVRAQIANMLMDALREGKIEALIARSADFYGPSIRNTSILTTMVFENLAAAKTAMWMGDLHCQHAFTYTPDAAKATALLGNSGDAYGQVWHLPTASDPPTGKEWIDLISSTLGAKPKVRKITKPMTRLIGLFIPIMREMTEMFYQYDRDYIFSSQKFASRFDVVPTPYVKGIEEIVDTDYGGVKKPLS